LRFDLARVFPAGYYKQGIDQYEPAIHEYHPCDVFNIYYRKEEDHLIGIISYRERPRG
jgi:hypothetical protein